MRISASAFARLAAASAVVALAPAARGAEPTRGALQDPVHDYKATWPDGTPQGVVVFLHGVSLHPFEEEGAGMDALAKAATRRGLVAVFPVGRRVCDWEKPKVYERCWLLDQVDDEMRDVRRIVRAVEKTAGVHFEKRQLIGFSNGGFLVAGALQRGLLDGFTRVGIIAGGPVGDVVPPPDWRLPHTYIEVGKDDRWQRGTTKQLMTMLSTTAYDESLHYREVPGGHVFDGQHAASFLAWFWDDAG